MATIAWYQYGQATFVNATRFFAAAGGNVYTGSTEANAQVTVRSAGTFSSPAIRVVTNGSTVAPTWQFRKNTANGNEAISITASTTGEFTDSVNTDAVVVADLIGWEFSQPTGTRNLVTSSFSYLFAATTNTVQRVMTSSAGGVSDSTASSTVVLRPSGGNATTATGADAEVPVRSSATLQNFQTHVSANARTTATTVGSYKNGATAAMSTSIASSATGWFEDTVNTDSLVSGDLFAFYATTGSGSGTITLDQTSAGLSTTDGSFQALGHWNGAIVGASTTNYVGFGACALSGTTESAEQQRVGVAYTGSVLWLRVSNNSRSDGSTFQLRKNAGNASQVISISAAATGNLSDAVNTDSFIAADELALQIVTGGGTGTLIVQGTGMLAQTSAGTAFMPSPNRPLGQAVNRVATFFTWVHWHERLDGLLIPSDAERRLVTAGA